MADVAVVIPTYNRADLLPAAVDSVLRQTLPPREVIVVDDGSTDDTQEVLSRYGTRIRAITTENVERGAARNLGVAAAASTWVAFLDSDDEWHPRKLELQCPSTRPGSASITGLRIDGPGLASSRLSGLQRPASVKAGNPHAGAASALLVERSVFTVVGGFPEAREIQGSEDWVLLVKLAASGVQVESVDEPLTVVRIHGGNDTGSVVNVERARTAAVEHLQAEGYLTATEADAARAVTAATLARMRARAGDWGAAVRSLREHARHAKPRHLLTTVFLCGVSAAYGVVRRARSLERSA